MADPEIQNLKNRATQLRSLADHVDSLVSSPKTYSTNTMKKWAGPNADKVRGELKTWHTKCTSVAKALRDKATEYDNEATKATNKSDK